MRTLPYPVYDADNHYYETADAFMRYLPKKYASEFRYVQVDGRTKLAVCGMISDYIPNPTFEVVAAPGSHELWYRGKNTEGKSMRELVGKPIRADETFRNGDARLKLLDQQGIYATMVYPTLASVVEERMNHDHELMAAVLSALNHWVADEWGFARAGRLFSVPMVSLADVDLAIKDLEYALSQGARAVGVRPAPVPGYRGSKSPGSAEFDPFWARCAEAKIFVCLHLSDSGYDAFYYRWSGKNQASEAHAFETNDPLKSFLDPMGRAASDMISALIAHGVPDRHPDIRFVSTENGAHWVAPLLARYKHVYGQMPQAFKRDPTETFRRNFFVVPFYEDNIRSLADEIGIERVLFGSDYPHAEGLAEPLSFLDELKGFSDAEVQQVMSSNLKGLLEGVRN